jgi:methylated-DNA-[protein]-cysteine S-methyltransferase
MQEHGEGEKQSMYYINHYTSPLGNMTMANDGTALTGLWFDDQKYFALGIDGNVTESDLDFPVFHETSHWLDLYFSGICPDFTPKLNLRGTDFQKIVWSILLTIPYGSTRSYREIADQIAAMRGVAHMSAQAVGGAVGHNPVSIIVPCHRVLGSDGSLTGYAGGLEKKRYLLELERANGNNLA